jgi:hypothetical protein
VKESYRIERHPRVGAPAVTVPTGRDLQLNSHGLDGVDEWLVYDARSHLTLGLPAQGPRRRFHLVVVDHGWKPVA